MRNRDQGFVDILEIFHGRQLRDQIIAQLKRLDGADASLEARHDPVRRKASAYYEAMLITMAELLGELGDRRPLD
jgi:hypothetical protein